MLNAPRCVPVYRNGRLEHFADMRGFIHSIPDAASAPPRNADSAPGSATPDSGARSFNLDACMKMGEG